MLQFMAINNYITKILLINNFLYLVVATSKINGNKRGCSNRTRFRSFGRYAVHQNYLLIIFYYQIISIAKAVAKRTSGLVQSLGRSSISSFSFVFSSTIETS